MYEQFGAHEVPGNRIRFQLFFPDNALSPTQYAGTADPQIQSIRVAGNFQSQLAAPANTDWDFANAPVMSLQAHSKGRLFEWVSPALAPGFYEYKYLVAFNGPDAPAPRKLSDPCTRYGGSSNENSAVVIGGHKTTVHALATPKPVQDLVIYELMIDDFTSEYRGTQAPIAAISKKLNYLQSLGVNAIEFMPWTAWPGSGFSWGYDPFQYFSVEYAYTDDPSAPLDKLYYLKELINECHKRGIHVILDVVLNHVSIPGTDLGFAYYWMYRDPIDCPYIGNFAGSFGGLTDLNFSNECTNEFIVDMLGYWIDVFKVDGFRFDYTLGLYKAADKTHGLTRIISDLNAHLSSRSISNFLLSLEHLSEPRYTAIDVVNKVSANSCWYQSMLELSRDYLYNGINSSIMRLLDSNRDFASGAPTTYIETHDHTTLAWHANQSGDVWKLQAYAIALFTSAGAALMHNGQEWGEQYWFPEPPGSGRVQSRPLRWAGLSSTLGSRIFWLYSTLAYIRNTHAGLRSPNFYPPNWQDWQTKPDGNYGVDVENGTVVFHRWGNDAVGTLERFIIVLNCSSSTRGVHVSFPVNGVWTDLLNGGAINVGNYHWYVSVSSNWGHIYWISGV